VEYLSCLKLETAPEKGERRISDDYIILIEEIFQEWVVDDSTGIPNGVKLFRICLLEYSLTQSEFNFDISLQLNKLYQSLNLNISFVEKLNYLGLKGIQMEALGYIAMRQFMHNNEADAMNFWLNKYFTFLKRNGKDVNHLKSKAFQSQNYDKVDEFYDYQVTMDNSYFHQIVKYLKNILQVKEKVTNDTWMNDFWKGMANLEYEYFDEKFNCLDDAQMAKHFIRTQNIEVWTGKYSTVPKFSEVPQKWRRCDYYSKAPGDPIFGFLKYSTKNNYKPGVVNSLSVFEHPLVYQIYKGLFTLTGLVQQKAEIEKINKLSDCLSEKLDIFEKFFEEEKDRGDFKDEYNMIHFFVQFLRSWFSINALCGKLLPLKEIKSDNEVLNKSIQDIQDFIFTATESIQTPFKNTTLWKFEKSEESKLDPSDISAINAHFSQSHTHFVEGLKMLSFLETYCLPMYTTSFHSLHQTVTSLSPKKKKKNFAETPLNMMVHSPCKEMIKLFKEWLGNLVEIYARKDYTNFVEQISEHANEYFAQVEALKACDGEEMAKSFELQLARVSKEMIVEIPPTVIIGLKNMKTHIKNISF
jgi:hypothetical protein